jgi:hypothetical protein
VTGGIDETRRTWVTVFVVVLVTVWLTVWVVVTTVVAPHPESPSATAPSAIHHFMV